MNYSHFDSLRHEKYIYTEFLFTEPLGRKIYFDNVRGTIGYGNTYGEHSYNSRPFVTLEEFFVILGDINYRECKFEKALELYNKAYDIAEKEKDDLRKAEFSTKIGRLYIEIGKFPEALKYLEDALKILKEKGVHISEIEVLGLIGETYRRVGNLKEAQKFYEELFDIADSISETAVEKGMGFHYAGKYYQAVGQHDKAFELLHKALEIFERCNYEYGIASVYNNLGIHNRHKGNLRAAAEYFEKAKTIFQKLGIHKDVEIVELNTLILKQRFISM
ncbi:MAG: tetratricopeptide repeat protein [Nitrospirota bacterium]